MACHAKSPWVRYRHCRAQWRSPEAADIAILQRATARVWPELGFKFRRTTAGNLRVPDVSYYLPGSVKPDLDEDYPEMPPDLAAEVRSEGQGSALAPRAPGLPRRNRARAARSS